ncbi:MAG: rane protein [Microbacteriaceae bacterium]|nr:rane protein [Microbacteriaceae bacterium]
MTNSDTSPTTPQTVPSGWYPDADTPSTERWWDGAAWSDERRPLVAVAPAGWFPDEERPGGERYWSGGEWTDQRRTIITGKNGLYNAEIDRRRGKNGAAGSALVLGIIAAAVAFIVVFTAFLSIPGVFVAAAAIVWGAIGISRANKWQRDGGQPIGRGKAIWGLVLGCVAAPVLLVGVLLVL